MGADCTEGESLLDGRFMLRRVIGEGGMGTVYEAFDRGIGRSVALKRLLRADDAKIGLIKREFRSLAETVHPRLVSPHELFCDGDEWFFTMELVDGVDFLHYVTRGEPDVDEPGRSRAAEPCTAREDSAEPLPHCQEARLREALRQLAGGLGALHGRGLVHCDIKPSNVLVDARGEVRVLDFGLVIEGSGKPGPDGTRHAGTPAYMAPEQAAGAPATPASDWYAVGVMLYEALTGRVPFDGNTEQVLAAKQQRDPVAPRLLAGAVPADLDDLCCRLLRRDPAERPTGAELLAVLGARPALEPGASPRFVGRRRELAALHAALASVRERNEPGVVYLHGGAGLGKSALLQRFLAELAVTGDSAALTLSGCCYEREWVPYKALDGVLEQLRSYLRSDGGRHLAEVLNPLLGAAVARTFQPLRSLWPAGGVAAGPRERAVSRPPAAPPLAGGKVAQPAAAAQPLAAAQRAMDGDSLGARRESFRALKSLLSLLSWDAPLVIAIDDAQWGDRDSARLLAEIIAPPRAPRLLLLLAYRDEASPGALLPELEQAVDGAGVCAFRRLALLPLPATDAAALVRSVQPDISAEATVAAVVAAAGGHPLFLKELARQAVRSREVAGSVQLDELIRARLGSLPPEQRTLVEVVSVSGQALPQQVAAEAAQLLGEPLALVRRLCADGLLSFQPGTAGQLVDISHERMRQAVLATLNGQARRALHARLAAAHRAQLSAPEVLAHHCCEAGEQQLAAAYALEAAERARAALAYDREARMCQLALEALSRIAPSSPEPPELERALSAAGLRAQVRDPPALVQRRLRERLATALAHAGRGQAAAKLLLSLLPEAEGMEAVDLRRRAALLLLASGANAEGIAQLRSALEAVGLHYPRRTSGAALTLLWRMTRLLLGRRLFWLQGEPERAARLSSRERMQLQICYSAGLGLSAGDPVRSGYFMVRAAELAHKRGEPAMLARGLSYIGLLLAYGGGPTTKPGLRLIDEAEEIAERSADHHARGWVGACRGIAQTGLGAWRAGLKELERSAALLCEVPGTRYEQAIARTTALLALGYVGDLRSLFAQAQALRLEAEGLGDLFVAVEASVHIALALLARNDVPAARRALDSALRRWHAPGFFFQHWLALRHQLYLELYEGARPEALERLRCGRQQAQRAGLMSTQIIRADADILQAGLALELLRLRRGSRLVLLVTAERALGRLRRERRPWVLAVALALEAGLARVRRRRGALELLASAATALDQAQLSLHAACARLRLAQAQGDTGSADAATRAVAAHGVADPDRYCRITVPGF